MRVLDDARWSCRSCARCCKGFAFGPVEPSVIEGLKQARIEEQWPPALESWFEERPGPEGQPTFWLTHRDGHCVFLREDKLCQVHATLGEAAKPWFCREYPFVVVDSEDGPALDVRPDCGGFHESFQDGAALSDHVSYVEGLPRPVPRPRFEPKDVLVAPGLAVDRSNWLAIEPTLISRLEPADPEQSVRKVRELIYGMAGRPAPAADFKQTWSATAAVMDHLDSDPLQALFQAAGQHLGRLPELEPSGQAYLHRVLRADLHTRRFGQLGASVPAGLGLTLFEARMARLAAPVQDAAHLGPHLSELRRTLQIPAVWQRVRALRPALEALAWTA